MSVKHIDFLLHPILRCWVDTEVGELLDLCRILASTVLLFNILSASDPKQLWSRTVNNQIWRDEPCRGINIFFGTTLLSLCLHAPFSHTLTQVHMHTVTHRYIQSVAQMRADRFTQNVQNIFTLVFIHCLLGSLLKSIKIKRPLPNSWNSFKYLAVYWGEVEVRSSVLCDGTV